MKHTLPHRASSAAMHDALDQAFASYQQRYQSYQPQLSWQDAENASFKFTVKGITLNGKVKIDPGALTVEIDVPFMFRLFQKKAVEVVEREASPWITLAEKNTA